MNLTSRRILVIEDDEALNHLVQKTLRKAGFEVESVSTGVEAIERITSNPDMALLLDIKLPDKTGSEIIKDLIERNCLVPFIVMTSHGDEKTAVKMMKLGARDYLVKGLNLIELLPGAFNNLFRELDNEQRLHETEKALRESEERFRQLADNAQDMIYRMSIPDGRYEYVSPAITRILGLKSEDLFHSHLLIKDIIHPDWHEYFAEQWKTLLAGEIPPSYEYQIIHAQSGETRWLHQRNVLIHDDDGHPKALEASVTDITDRKRSEEKIENNRRFLDSLLEQSPFPTWISDSKGTMIRANPALKKVLNITDEQLIGKYNVFRDTNAINNKIVDIFHDALEKGKTSDFNLTWSGQEIKELNLKDSNTVYAEGTVFPIYNHEGAITNLVVTWKDSSDRKLAEEELQKSEERFRRLAENAQDMIYSMSLPDGHYEYVSPAATKLFGYTPDEFLSSPLLIQKAIHPDWHEYFAEQWKKLQAGEMPKVYEYQIIHGQSGETRWLHQRNVLIRDDAGQTKALEAIVTDITDRKNCAPQCKNWPCISRIRL